MVGTVPGHCLVFLCWLRLRASVWPRLADRVQVMLHLLQEQKRRQASGEPDALCRLPMRPITGTSSCMTRVRRVNSLCSAAAPRG